MEGDLLYLKSTDQMLIVSKNTFPATRRLAFDQTTGHHGPARLTHRIIHHSVIEGAWVPARGSVPI